MNDHHLILSPHPDDAVFSCGGLIFTLARLGQRVSVWTLMSQDAPPAVVAMPFIQALHQRWGLGDQPYTRRRAEDEAANKALGAQKVVFGDWHDAIYRVGATDGRLLYTDDDALFGPVQTDDPLARAELNTATWADVTHVYIPLAVGNHVDHQVVTGAAQVSLWHGGIQRYFYEDYPYSATSEEVFFAHGGSKARPYGTMAIQSALQKIPQNPKPYIQEMATQAIEAKISAIALYQSQISTFWPSLGAMADSVRDYHQQIGSRAGFQYAESYWVLPD